MRKIYTLACLFLFATQLSAQQDSLKVDVEAVIVHANRIGLKFKESSNSIVVINREMIERAPVQSVAELLHYVAGIDVRQRGINGVQADISIRGGSFEQALILVNGIKMSDPQTGHHNFNLPVDIESIERIEIMKGPGARVYGQNAFAGAINIITKLPDERYAALQVTAGENALGGIRVSAALPNSNFKQYLSFSRQFTEGYRHNTDYNLNTLFYQNQFTFVNNTLDFMASLSEREFGANAFYAPFPDQYEEVQTSLVSLGFQHKRHNFTSKARVSWRRNQDMFLLFRNEPLRYRNMHINQTYSLEWNNTYKSNLGTTGFGLDLQRVRLQSNNLGEHRRNLAGLFLEHRFLFGKFDATPGVSYYYYSDFGSRFFPGLDLGYAITNTLKVFGNVGYTWRLPTYTDRFYNDPYTNGNPDLEPESALSYEVGLKYNDNGLQLQLNGFYRNGTNLIDWVKFKDEDPWVAQNYNKINTYGAEFSANINPGLLAGREFFINNINLAYTLIEAELGDVEGNPDLTISRYAFEQLKHQFVFGLDYDIVAGISHSIRFRYADRVTEAVGDYMLVDTRLSWKSKLATVYVEATNLFGEEYLGENLVPMPERWIRAGVNFKFRY